jgi:hypothetical protein
MNSLTFLKADSVSSLRDTPIFKQITWYDFNSNRMLFPDSDPTKERSSSIELRDPYISIVDPPNPAVIRCQGEALCLKGEVVKVTNGKSFYVLVNNKMIRVDLALIALSVTNQQAMMAATTFTRNSCLGSTVIIDQDDGQTGGPLIGTVYCSPTKSLNSLLLDTGYVNLNNTQCHISEFSKSDWAKSYGC